MTTAQRHDAEREEGARRDSRPSAARRPDGAPAHATSAGRRLLDVLRDPAVRSAFYAFALTRLFVFLVLVVGGYIGHISVGSYDTARDFHLRLDKTTVSRALRETVQTADINWYLGIAENGYEKQSFSTDRPHNWAFFPLFPLLWRGAARLTGEMVFTGMLLSNLFFFAALVLVYKTAREFGLEEADADRALFYLAIFPVSYFFSLPLTESLFLLLTVGSFLAARRRRWWLAGALGALASATRVTGVLLLPALLLLYWQTYGRGASPRELVRPPLFGLFLIPLGFLSFTFYLYLITGNPLAFRDVLVTWGRGTGLFLIPLVSYLREPLLVAIPWDFRLVNFAAAATVIVCGLVLLKRREWALACYTLSSVVVSLSSLILQSQARYAMVLFPVFMVLAVAGRGRRFDEGYRVVSLVLFTLMLALFAAHYSIAMA